VPFIDEGHLSVRVWCKEDAGVLGPEPVRYAIAVTIEAGSMIPVYEQIEQRLRIAQRPRRCWLSISSHRVKPAEESPVET
jgi:hypothetical protein